MTLPIRRDRLISTQPLPSDWWQQINRFLAGLDEPEPSVLRACEKALGQPPSTPPDLDAARQVIGWIRDMGG